MPCFRARFENSTSRIRRKSVRLSVAVSRRNLYLQGMTKYAECKQTGPTLLHSARSHSA
jgi:hypothetical protein